MRRLASSLAIAAMAISALVLAGTPVSAAGVAVTKPAESGTAAAADWRFYTHFNDYNSCQYRGISLVQDGFYSGWQCRRTAYSWELWVR